MDTGGFLQFLLHQLTNRAIDDPLKMVSVLKNIGQHCDIHERPVWRYVVGCNDKRINGAKLHCLEAFILGRNLIAAPNFYFHTATGIFFDLCLDYRGQITVDRLHRRTEAEVHRDVGSTR